MAPGISSNDVPAPSQKAGDSELGVISIAKLINGDAKTQSDLLTACKDMGFFYLDFRDYSSGRILNQINSVAATSLEFYRLPDSEKNRYKPAGVRTGCVEGKKDGWEMISFFEHHLSKFPQMEELPAPAIFQRERKLIEETNANLGEISRIILDSLSRSLGLDDSMNLAQYHCKDQPSATSLEVLKYLPYTAESQNVGHVPHTDMGSLSMVFAEVGGLQVYHPHKKVWAFVEPKVGHAVCNVGDSLDFLSGNVLRSSLHRVVPCPREKGNIKMSVCYFLRPDTTAEFVDRSGKRCKAIEWQNMKAQVFIDGLEEKAPRTVLTGREGHTDFWDET